MIHNQPLIQFLSALTIVVPLPLAISLFWFAFSSALAIQSLLGVWAAVAMIHVFVEILNRWQDRANRLQR